MIRDREKMKKYFIGGGILLALLIGVVVILWNLDFTLENIPAHVEVAHGEDLPAVQPQACLQGYLVDADIQVSGQVDLEKAGTYTLTYASKYFWYTAQKLQTITIVDKERPVITLKGDDEHYTLPGHTYEEEGYTAWDKHDGDITDKVQRRESNGNYIYWVTDSNGNTAEVCRNVLYADYTAPELTLHGSTFITIMAGQTYSESGYTAVDNADGDITDKVQVSDDFSIYAPGTYTITYTVKDRSGNQTQKTRTLTVVGRTQVSTVSPSGKVIYLTFDDGPSQHTPRLLSILKKYNVKATFFVVGTAALGYVDDIYNDGHAVALHTNTHDFDSLYASEEAYFADLYAVQDKVYQYAGIRPTMVRFPGGSSNTISRSVCKGIMSRLVKAVPAMGFQYYDWNVDSMDAGGAWNADQVFQNVVNGVKNRNVSIVLQHDIHGFSVDAVERIIQWGLANGYTFLPLTPESPKAHHGVNN